jgi:peroxiredoxin
LGQRIAHAEGGILIGQARSAAVAEPSVTATARTPRIFFIMIVPDTKPIAPPPSGQRLCIYFIAITVSLAIAYWALGRPGAAAEAPAVTMRSIQGEQLSLPELRGKVVLVSFWATDCSVCLQEMPAMVQTYERFRARGLEAIFIAMPYDRPDHVLHYAQRESLPFKVVLDVQGEINRAFGGVRATPTTFIVDRRGRIVERIVGAPDFRRLHRFIAARLDAAD